MNRQQLKQFMQSLLTDLMAHDCKHMYITDVVWLHCIGYFRYQSEQNQAAKEYLVEQVSMKVGDTHSPKSIKRKLCVSICLYIKESFTVYVSKSVICFFADNMCHLTVTTCQDVSSFGGKTLYCIC